MLRTRSRRPRVSRRGTSCPGATVVVLMLAGRNGVPTSRASCVTDPGDDPSGSLTRQIDANGTGGASRHAELEREGGSGSAGQRPGGGVEASVLGHGTTLRRRVDLDLVLPRTGVVPVQGQVTEPQRAVLHGEE